MQVKSKIRSAVNILKSPDTSLSLYRAIRRNWRTWHINRHGNNPFCWQAPGIGKFVCIPGCVTSEQLFVDRAPYEEAEIDWCRRWLRKGDVCIDVGANIGQFAAALSPSVGEAGKIISVEPSPVTFKHLSTTISHLNFKNVITESACVSDSLGRVKFMQANVGTSDVTASMRVNPASGEFIEIDVPSITIESLVSKHASTKPCTLVKIDIEGAEPLALKSAGALLNEETPALFLVEVHKAALANFGFTPLDILQFFSKHHYKLFHVHRSKSDLTPQFRYGVIYPLLNPEKHDWPWYSNLIAVPKSGIFVDRVRHLNA